MAFCFCCLTSDEKVHIAMKSYGKAKLLSEMESCSGDPQLILGRIVPVNKVLTTPITGKSSVYYQVQVEHLEDRTDQNTALSGEVEGDKVWSMIHGEANGCDFMLIDPSTTGIELFVPGVQVDIRVHITQEILNHRSIGLRMGLEEDKSKSKSLSPEIKRYLDALHVKYLDHHGHLNKNLRLKEASFDTGEQVAVIGTVREMKDADGCTYKVLLPVSEHQFTDEFSRSKGFSDWDVRSWRDLTRTPCIIITDMPQYFQDVTLPVLPPDVSTIPNRKPIILDNEAIKNPSMAMTRISPHNSTVLR